MKTNVLQLNRRAKIRSDLGIVSGIPIPERGRRRGKAWAQLKACEVGDSFLTKSWRVYVIAKKLGVQIRVESNGRGSDRYYRVWKIKDAPCA